MVVEAGTANSAFAKGGRCPTVRQPLSTWAPALHRTDEPLVLCQSFLIALIGRQRALSTPIRENFSPPVPAGWPGAHAVSGERLLPADGSARATRQHRRGGPRLRKPPNARPRGARQVPSSQAQTLHGRLLRGGPTPAAETRRHTYTPLKIPTSKLRGRDGRATNCQYRRGEQHREPHAP